MCLSLPQTGSSVHFSDYLINFHFIQTFSSWITQTVILQPLPPLKLHHSALFLPSLLLNSVPVKSVPSTSLAAVFVFPHCCLPRHAWWAALTKTAQRRLQEPKEEHRQKKENAIFSHVRCGKICSRFFIKL